MNQLYALRLRTLWVQYSAIARLPPGAEETLSCAYSPNYFRYIDKYRKWDSSWLLWFITASSRDLVLRKKVVRNYCMRKVRQAFRESLRVKGYNEQGFPMISFNQNDSKAESKLTHYANLRGYLRFHILSCTLKSPNEHVQRDTDKIIEWLQRLHESKSVREALKRRMPALEVWKTMNKRQSRLNEQQLRIARIPRSDWA